MQLTIAYADMISLYEREGNIARADALRAQIGTDCDVTHHWCHGCKDWYHPEDFRPHLFSERHVNAVTERFGGRVCVFCMQDNWQDEDGEWHEA